MPGATVTMAHVQWPSALTDASGSYKIGVTGNPLGNAFVARAQVVAVGHDFRWFPLAHFARSLFASGMLGQVGHVDLQQSQTGSWPSRRRVAYQLRCIGSGTAGNCPPVEVCCVDGNDQSENPITVPVARLDQN